MMQIHRKICYIRIICVLLISLCSIASTVCQQDFTYAIDSIKQELAGDLRPIARINRNLKLVSYYKFSHPSVDSLIESSLSLAEKKNLKFYIARSLKFRARYKIYLNAPKPDLLADIERIDSLSRHMDNKLLPGWVSRLYAHYHLLVGNLPEAKINIDSLNRQLHDNKYANRGSYYTILGMYHQQNRNYQQAITEYTNALNSINPGRTFIYNNLARLHLELQNSALALSYANKAVKFSAVQKNVVTRIESKIIIGEVYMLEKDTIKALINFEEAERLRNTSYYTKNYTAVHRLIDIYKETDRAKADSLLEDITSFEFLDVYPLLLVEQGISSAISGQKAQAAALCAKGVTLAANRLRHDYAVRGCDCLIDLYRSTGDVPNQAKYLAKKIDYQALVNDEARILSLARNVTNYESKKEKALIKQAFEKDQEILSQRLQKFQIGILLSLLILGIGGIAIWQLRRKNGKIETQNKIISKALSEKDLLLREIHHRVKNNLQMVSSLLTLQGRSLDDQSAQVAIQEGKNRVRSMALIHQDLYNKENLTDISVKEYIEKLTRELLSTYKSKNITLQTDITDIDLDIDTMIPLGLIINELITNSLKYGFPDNINGTISVSLHASNSNLTLTVADDGVGYKSEDYSPSSFGSTLVSALTAQIEGSLQRATADGTSVTIVFPDSRS